MTNEIITQMDNLIHNRFNKKTLEEKLSTIFNEDIKIELICEDVDYLSDWNYAFTSTNDDTKGDYDIYVLMHKNKAYDGAEFMVTEWSYQEF